MKVLPYELVNSFRTAVAGMDFVWPTDTVIVRYDSIPSSTMTDRVIIDFQFEAFSNVVSATDFISLLEVVCSHHYGDSAMVTYSSRDTVTLRINVNAEDDREATVTGIVTTITNAIMSKAYERITSEEGQFVHVVNSLIVDPSQRACTYFVPHRSEADINDLRNAFLQPLYARREELVATQVRRNQLSYMYNSYATVNQHLAVVLYCRHLVSPDYLDI